MEAKPRCGTGSTPGDRDFWGCSSAGRASAWQAEGQGFESPLLHQSRRLGQVVWLGPYPSKCSSSLQPATNALVGKLAKPVALKATACSFESSRGYQARRAWPAPRRGRQQARVHAGRLAGDPLNGRRSPGQRPAKTHTWWCSLRNGDKARREASRPGMVRKRQAPTQLEPTVSSLTRYRSRWRSGEARQGLARNREQAPRDPRSIVRQLGFPPGSFRERVRPRWMQGSPSCRI
jgi:hypothetical protein